MDLDYLDFKRIGPQSDRYDKTCPSKIVVVGKAGTGKSVVIENILHNMVSKIHQGVVICGTEDITGNYRRFFPSTFVYTAYKEEPIRALIAFQKARINEGVQNPWSVLIVDDCAYDRKFFTSPLQSELFKNARHWYILYILAIQYSRDIPTYIRAATDMTFILREHNVAMRRMLYENYASIIPSFALFVECLAYYTANWGCLVVDNMTCEERWQSSVFHYMGDPKLAAWRFGDAEFWQFHKAYIPPQSAKP
jgi:hypothetical protein